MELRSEGQSLECDPNTSNLLLIVIETILYVVTVGYISLVSLFYGNWIAMSLSIAIKFCFHVLGINLNIYINQICDG